MTSAPPAAQKPSPFCTIICGAGIAGLTLANALQLANVDYILLEARDEICPEVGASIGIFSNGGRILDQIGVHEGIQNKSQPTDYMNIWYKGMLVAKKDGPQLLKARSGYPLIFTDRSLVLRELYSKIKDKERVKAGKRVFRVDHSDTGVVVHCNDGSSFHGDLVVGADGVRSCTRKEMWRNANLAQPGTIGEGEMNKLTAEYTCIYGISNPCGLEPGNLHFVVGIDTSFLVVSSKDSRTYWFYFSRMPKVYQSKNIPKWTREDAIRQANGNLDFKITDKIRFGDLWKRQVSFTLVSLEEAVFDHWTWGRFACIGDSIHKMTPNLGQGGNNAIETAAALANRIKLIADDVKSGKISHEHIVESLRIFQKKREPRTQIIYKIAYMMTRIEGLKGIVDRLLGILMIVNVEDYIVNMGTANTIAAEKLEYLPDPPRSFTGSMPFNPSRGIGKEESRLRRALIALPFMLLAGVSLKYLCSSIYTVKASFQLVEALTSGTLPSTEIHLRKSYYGPFKFLDRTFRPLVACFAPSLLNTDPLQRFQILSFLAELAPVYLIWILESSRRANGAGFMRLFVVFGYLAQIFGIGAIAPIYHFVHYVHSPISVFNAGDQRMHQVSYAKTALPTILLAYILPTFAMFLARTGSARLMLNSVWQLFPVWLSITHYVLSNYFVTDTTKTDRMTKTTDADLKHVRRALIVVILVAAATFNYSRFASGYSLSELFFPSTFSTSDGLRTIIDSSDLGAGVRIFAQYDYLLCFSSSFVWLALLFWDLRSEEMLDWSWTKLTLFGILGIHFAGPGAVVGLGWWLREETLASKRGKDAVVKKF